jgi:hypothetical protein
MPPPRVAWRSRHHWTPRAHHFDLPLQGLTCVCRHRVAKSAGQLWDSGAAGRFCGDTRECPPSPQNRPQSSAFHDSARGGRSCSSTGFPSARQTPTVAKRPVDMSPGPPAPPANSNLDRGTAATRAVPSRLDGRRRPATAAPSTAVPRWFPDTDEVTGSNPVAPTGKAVTSRNAIRSPACWPRRPPPPGDQEHPGQPLRLLVVADARS